MERYSIQQRVEIVKIYYQNGSSVRQTFRVLRSSVIENWVNRIHATQRSRRGHLTDVLFHT